MSYFLRNVIKDDDEEGSTPSSRATVPTFIKRTNHTADFAKLLRHCVALPGKGQILNLPTAERDDEKEGADPNHRPQKLDIPMENVVSLIAAPSSFGLHAIARTIVLKYSSFLTWGPEFPPECTSNDESIDEPRLRCYYEPIRPTRGNTGPSMAAASVECMLSVLVQLSKRDSELCVQALNALLSSLQLIRADSSEEAPALLRQTHATLMELYEEGSPEVASKAASCLVALSVSSFFPDFVFATAAAFLTAGKSDPGISPSESSILVPDNLHRLSLFVQAKCHAVPGHPSDWWSYSLADHAMLCAFDLSSMPSDSSPETPDDDKRLHSAIASDASYVYVLNHIGFYKIGTGFTETVLGRIYASNTMLKASRNCSLSFCNGSLYLRRGQSSRVWVLDRDSLREIGEIMLQPGPSNSTIFCDGASFYQAHLDAHSTLMVIKLNDSFLPLTESKAKQKIRLTKLAYSILGEAGPMSQRFLNTLPTHLQGQVSDLHLGRDVALMLARSGKVYYAGNPKQLGLASAERGAQEGSSPWLELVLPESVVQISVGTENVLFRSGTGHVWIAGPDDKRRAGRLRRLHTATRKKTISLAAAANVFAYVSENGKVFALGKHAWRTQTETGMVLGLDGVHIATIALGKSHAVAVSRHGQLYTWGVNNLGQCGRVEAPSAGSSPRHGPSPSIPSSSSATPGRPSTCLPTEHLFMRDVASLCVACGRCSGRGAACPRQHLASAGGLCPCGPGETACLRCGICKTCAEAAADAAAPLPVPEQLQPPEGSPAMANKIVLGPAKVLLQQGAEIKVASVSCGNFHTILLAADRQVFTFGSNCHGQLGVGNTLRSNGPQKVVLPSGMLPVQVAAGANHCVIRAVDGAVYTFGAHKSGQLGREQGDGDDAWHCRPELVPGIGPASGTLAGWIGASGDATTIHAHTSLLSEDAIGDAQIVANKSAIFIFPRQIGKEYVVVRRRANSFTEHLLGPAGLYTSYSLEPSYNVLWTYSAAEMRIGALVDAPIFHEKAASRMDMDPHEFLRFVRSPEMSIPLEGEVLVSPQQMAAQLLASTYALTLISAMPETKKELSHMVKSTTSNGGLDGRSIVSRFESNGGGWGYSAHSVDAVQFKCSVDIKVLGVGLYGGRGEYNAKVRVARLQGPDVDEMYTEEMATTDEILYECPPRDVAPISFSRPFIAKAGQWHVVSVRISGPSSDCGSNGRTILDADGVTFTFRNSSLSNNGTDVTVGQIPEIYFHNLSAAADEVEEKAPDDKAIDLKMYTDMLCAHRSALVRPAHSVYASLLSILRWAKGIVFEQPVITENALWERERGALIAMLVLKILRFYTETLYPSDDTEVEEPPEMAESMVDMYTAINEIFEAARDARDENENDPSHLYLIDECVTSLVTCAQLVISTPAFMVARLAHLMGTMRKEWELAGLLYSMTRLKDILVLFPDVMARPAIVPKYPLLAEQFLASAPKISEKARSMTSLQNVASFLFDIAFGRGATELVTSPTYSLDAIARDMLRTIARELVKGECTSADLPPIQNSATRFRRRSVTPIWDMSTGAVDSITFRVDKNGVVLAGVGVFTSGNEYSASYTLEVLKSESDVARPEDWESIERVTTRVICEHGRDAAHIKLNRPVVLNPSSFYAINVQSTEGGRTFGGEGGLNTVRLLNGARILFSNCSLSENGTCLARGQIPYILYYCKEGTKTLQPGNIEKKTAPCFFSMLRLMTAKVSDAIASGTMTSSARDLVSSIAGFAMVLMEASPRRALEVVAIVDQLLPMVSSINGTAKAEEESVINSRCTESASRRVVHTTVESSHPYRSGCVESVVCGFDKEVKLLYIEMDECSRTAAADDILWLYVGVDRECYVPVARFCGSIGWKHRQLMLPGNSLWFILESGAPVEGATDDDMYGFRCTVYGYSSLAKDSNLRLEQELAWLSASACRLLVQLPSSPDELTSMCIAEEETRDLLEKHGALLRKGLNISHVPTLHELNTRGIPPAALSPELKFIREFMAASSTTVAGALSRWLPVGPQVDPSNCQLILPQDEFTVGSAAVIKFITRDQYGRLAQCCSLKVEVTIRKEGHGITRSAENGGGMGGEGGGETRETWCPPGSLPPPSLFSQNPYVPVYMNKSRYMSIGMMPAFAGWSYEELRLAHAAEGAKKDVIAMMQRGGTTHTGTWFPRAPGTFHVECTVDGFALPHSYSVEVVDNSTANVEGTTSRKGSTRVAQLSRARVASIPSTAPFLAVRIRTSPSLNAPAIGQFLRGASLSYMEELENSDGKWLRITDESIGVHAHSPHFPAQAWCLQYHRALDRVLVDIGNGLKKDGEGAVRKQEEVAAVPEECIEKRRPSEQSVLIEANEMYVLSDGDKVDLYVRPSLSALCKGEALEGRQDILSDGWIHNSHGVWIRVAGSQRYILAEDAIGRSSVHSQVGSMNGNEDEDEAASVVGARNQLRPRETRALRPSVVDCSRTVFAAFLWHEHLVKDAMAAATYLRFHPALHNLWSSHPDSALAVLPMVPPPLQPLLRLWKDISTVVQTSIDQHLIMPSPPAIRYSAADEGGSSSAKGSPLKHAGGSAGGSDAPCELCDERYRPGHMRMAHCGCGGPSQGYGYNSSGKYTTGWTGACGDGGRPGTSWFLLCPTCRQKYLRDTAGGHHQERKRRWREFRLSSAMESRPETVMKANALFLLDLNSSAEGADSKTSSVNTSGWTINLFPTAAPATGSPSPIGGSHSLMRDVREKLAVSTTQVARRDSDPVHLRVGAAHASDPGPKNPDEERGGGGAGPSEVLQSPSVALKSLVSLTSSTASTPSMLRRPVMAFVIEHHDLKRVRDASVQSVHRAVAFAHAFRVWNWLLRLVSSETSVSDVILQYVWALSSYTALTPVMAASSIRNSPVRLLPHPWRLCFLAGPLSTWMVQQMHSFLYTVAVILQSATVDSRLRSLCFKAWTIQLSAHEQDLLILTCNILATVGGVLSEPSSDALCMGDSMGLPVEEERTRRGRRGDAEVDVKTMVDVSSQCRLEASSRSAMVVCLTDGSTETFWESGEEDKARARTIGARFDSVTAVLLCIYIDNVKDEQYRTNFISVRKPASDGSRKAMFEQAVEPGFVGWIKCCVAGISNALIILKGPCASQRIRQITVFGLCPSAAGSPSSPPPPRNHSPSSPSHMLSFSSPQRDAFALFQAISSQAFSEELSEEQHTSLRQRVLDLLFSRVHLAPLQTYVCSQIVNALEREVTLLRERGKRNYSYACGLMSMVVRVIGSRKGTEVFSARDHLLLTLSELLMFAPQTVQCQVIESIERLIPVFHPQQIDLPSFVSNLLVCIAKVLSLQVRDKATKSVNTLTFAQCCSHSASAQWRLDKEISPEVGRLAMQLIVAIASGRYSEDWSTAVRRELGGVLYSIVHLSTDVSSLSSTSTGSREMRDGDTMAIAFRARRFWLAVASLSALRDKAWLELVDGWRNIQAERGDEPESLCENHDDGKTMAQVHCEVCGISLCRDCFRILHLNKRNRSHEAHLIGGASSTPHVDVHEGCSRLRLHNMLILLHCSALTGMVEQSLDTLFPSASSLSIAGARRDNSSYTGMAMESTRCRFCSSPLPLDRQLIGVCAEEECLQLQAISTACDVIHQPCGHLCGGVRGEAECLPCMRCPQQDNKQDGDDVCVVCLIDRINAAPAVKLECGHVFHFHCLSGLLERRWNGPRILFRFMNCPLCNVQMSHPSLAPLVDPLLALLGDVETKAKMRLEYDGLKQCPAVVNPESEYHGRPLEYAMDRYMYVLCFKCGKAYFGGESRCQVALDTSQHNPSELICGGCSDVKGVQMCGKHGVEFLEYKCRFCCSIAVYFCFGTTHFCASCHDDFQRLMTLPKHVLPPCPVGPKATQLEGVPCPLRIEHAPTGEEFALGCGICRNLSTF